MESNDFLLGILAVLITTMVILFLVLVFLIINMKIKEKKQQEKDNKIKTEIPKEKKDTKTFKVGSVFDFMEFDKIEDNMIIQKNGLRFVMVIECQGINYDLMSQAEKVSVEEGFIQFLNTLSYPLQIYVQTRKINLENSIQTYKNEVEKIEQELNKQKIKYQNIISSPNATEEQKKVALYEFTKDKNLYEYGNDIIYNTEKMSLNRNILNKKYYVILPYFSEEISKGEFGKEEIREMAFSELYTRAQSIIRALSISGVVGKVLSSTELADLLYFAYNRDDAEIYGIDKAIRAGFNEMYSTSQDYVEKKMKILDKQIEDDAIKLANEKVKEAQTEKQKEYQRKNESKDDIVKKLAELIIKENETMIGKDVANKAKEKVRKEKKANVQEKTKE